MVNRRLEVRDGLQICVDEIIAVIDSGCDQCIININSFVIKSYSGLLFCVTGALAGMISGEALELVSDAYTLLICPDGREILAKFNQVLLDRNPDQEETLIQPHQLRSNGVVVDDVPTCHIASNGKPGRQCINVGGTEIPLYFDGYKTYLRLARPSEQQMKNYPTYVLTSEQPYEPQRRKCT